VITSIGRGVEDVMGELRKTTDEKTGKSAGLARARPPDPAMKSTATTPIGDQASML
jgi:hypothetical protein